MQDQVCPLSEAKRQKKNGLVCPANPSRLPYIKGKNKLGSGVVGLDIGPSTIAIVGEDSARLQALCPEVNDLSKNIKALQRKMNRSLRLNNPENFEEERVAVNSNRRRIKKTWKNKEGFLKVDSLKKNTRPCVARCLNVSAKWQRQENARMVSCLIKYCQWARL